MFQFGELGVCLRGLSPSSPPRGDETEKTGQKFNKLQVTIFSYKLL